MMACESSVAPAAAHCANPSEIRFLNSSKEGNRLESESDAQAFIAKARYDGVTPLGTSLDKRILQPMLIKPARNRSLRKPLLVIVITDGSPMGEPKDKRGWTKVYGPKG